MKEFIGKSSPQNRTVVEEDDIVQMCPKCTFPNYQNARRCSDCGFPLNSDSIIWIKAKQIKKCSNPNCSAYIAPNEQECPLCNYNTSQTPISIKPQNNPEDEKYVLVCPNCRHPNPANIDVCEKCSSDLIDIDPILYCEIPHTIKVSFEDYRNKKEVSIELDDTKPINIGVKAFLSEMLSDYPYVSRSHCEISYHDQSLWIRDCSTNGTYIKGKRLTKGQQYQLENGAIIGFGDPSFSEVLAAFLQVNYSK